MGISLLGPEGKYWIGSTRRQEANQLQIERDRPSVAIVLLKAILLFRTNKWVLH